ncbi:MAG: 4Fe-4S dicluster domain-containing protein [Nitrospirae bacterium]|jgi:ferredoxin|nr:4Fe-4S dicluster domain-containing protein [Nitrospirota bacterium]
MIFKVFGKKELPRLFDVIAVNRVVGPVQKGTDKNGSPLHTFGEVRDFAELSLDYKTTILSAKRFVLPFHETLCTFRVTENGWEKDVDFNVRGPTVFFGLHACDINAFNRLDKVLMESVYPTPYYASKRKNMFIIGTNCEPQPYCFCRSMGTDTALHGFDLFLTDIGDRYFAEVQSATAYNFLLQIKTADPKEKDHQRYMDVVAEKNKKFTAHVDNTDLTKILDMEFQSQAWKEWGDKCLSCGTCANVCPTCYCYGVEETVDMNATGARKIKSLHSCNLIDFAEVAGGHNFRPERHSRLKYRYYHKHRGFVEAFEESLCVGCGRCGEACLADITVPEVIASVRGEGH